MVRLSSDSGLSERDFTLLETLEQRGWYVIKVGATETEPAFAYSLGLYEHFRHPEIILFGLDLETMHRLINAAGEQIRQGQIYEEGRRYADLVKDYSCEFRIVNPRHYKGLVTYALWYYQGSPFPVLQLVWPDRDGLFPWNEGFDAKLGQKQPVLY